MIKLCSNPTCKIDYPHIHKGGLIDDAAEEVSWPGRLNWKRLDRSEHESPFHLFKFGEFVSHSGLRLEWKLDCETGLRSQDWDDIAKIITSKIRFSEVIGIPKGGLAMAEALQPYCEPNFPLLIVDDVLTTGKSMIEARSKMKIEGSVVGVVLFARGPCPNWVLPLMKVALWAQ